MRFHEMIPRHNKPNHDQKKKNTEKNRHHSSDKNAVAIFFVS